MRKSVKILHLIPGIASGGGAENVIYNLCRYVDRSKFELEIMYWSNNDDLAGPIRDCGVRTLKLPLKKVVSVATVRTIAKVLRERGAGLLHTHFMDGDLLGFLASRLVSVPMISHVHSYPYPKERRHALRYRLMAGGMNRIVCVSGHVRDHVRLMTGLPDDKFEVVFNGIDRDMFISDLAFSQRQAYKRSLGLGKDDFVIGNVSRLIAEKGHDFFLKAALIVLTRKPGVKFLIVGDGPERGRLGDMARRLGIADSVVFSGKRLDIPDLLKCMDIFVFPAFYEAFGICVVEAMTASVPVIATNDAAIPEVIRDGREGLLIPPGDEQSLAQTILRLIDDRVLSHRLAQAALVRSQDFTVQAMAKNVERVYEKVLGPG